MAETKIKILSPKAIVNKLIRAWSLFLRPLFPGFHCKYIPSCSQYMQDAVNFYGVPKGLIYGIWRILRCNPWSRGGYDPVIHTDRKEN